MCCETPTEEEEESNLTKLTVTLAAILFGTVSASAVTITSFTATPDNTGGFVPDTVNGTSDSTSVRITNTFVGCPATSSSACTGLFADFRITGTDLVANSTVTIHMDGAVQPIPSTISSASLIDSATGTISFWPTGLKLPQTTITHTYSVSGAFDKDIATDQIPQTLAAFDFSGNVSITLQPGQELALPSSLSLTFAGPAGPAGVPEPSAALLLGAGLGLVGLAKFRKARRA